MGEKLTKQEMHEDWAFGSNGALNYANHIAPRNRMIYVSSKIWVEIDKGCTEAEVNVDVEVHENGDTRHISGGGMASLKALPQFAWPD